MTILQGDIKLLQSDTMTDADEGGGAMTGTVIVDGESNNIFDDISTLDRVYGAVHLRKVFGAIQTQTQDKYFGSHIIISKLPGDAKLGVNLFNTEDWFDRRPTAQGRIENYRAQGALYSGFLWATQYQGSRVIAIFQSESAPVPGIGDVLLLKSSSASQYIRIVKLEQSIQTFTDASGQFKRRILNIEISDTLNADFVGAQISRLDTLNPSAKLYNTVVANAARYYSARPLALAGSPADLTVKVDSVYSQVVPASQSETAIIDQTAGDNAAPMIDGSQANFSFVTSTDFVANGTLYLGSPCLPGSLSIPVSGGTLIDEGGTLKVGETAIGTLNYAEGTLAFSASSPTYSGSKTVTFRPAAAPIRLADTASIPVTAANRGYVWVQSIVPPPEPGSLKISYRALDNWYTLSDNGNGAITGTETGIGTGTVNYVSGSVNLTLGALPDEGSEIIFSWGAAADFSNRSNFSLDPFKIRKVLTHPGVDSNTIVISWNDGQARTATGNAAGVISGDATGTFDPVTNTLEFAPSSLPLGGTTFTIDYSYGAATTKTLTPVVNSGDNTIFVDTGDVNIVAGSFAIAWSVPQKTIVSPTGTAQKTDNVSDWAIDDGLGALVSYGGTLNYAAGHLTFDPRVGFQQKTSVYTPANGAVSRVLLTGYTEVAALSELPSGDVTVRYRLAGAGSSAQETVDLAQIQLDLTPGYAETIVTESVLFALGGRHYVDRAGLLYYNIDPTTGAGTYAGTIDYSTGTVTLTAWATGASNSAALKSLVTTQNFAPVDQAVFRTPVAPIKPQSITIRAVPADGGGEISATADADGVILTADMDGYIEYETGVVNVRFGQWVTAAGNEGEWWYDPAAVVGGQIFRPKHVRADTIVYNAVAYTYLPLSADILGLDPVRLPADGRIPVYSAGDVLVVLHDQTTTGTYSNGTQTDLGRGRIAKLTVRDAAGNPVDVAKYSANLDTGIIDWVDLSGVAQPLTIVDRIEDMAVCTDVQITGTLTLSQPLTHTFPADETLVSNAIIYGTLYARTSIPFDQQTWTNVWSDSVIGSGVAAQYNNTQYPIAVDNASCIQEKWVLLFTNSTTVNVIGQNVGQILTGASISGDIAPINPNTGLPYFTIPYQGWGSGWSSGNCLRFNTYGANAPTWIIQAIGQGEATDTDYTFSLEFRGDIDTP